MTVLADTSIWVEYLRFGTIGVGRHLEALIRQRDLVVCGPVFAELLAGARQGDRAFLSSTLVGLPWAGIGTAEWQRIGELAGALRDRGLSVPLTDVTIAVGAEAAGATLWTRDSDFERIASVSSLRLYEPP